MTDSMASRAVPACPVCRSDGVELYARTPDRVFGTGGSWDLRRCRAPSCGLIWLTPQPLPEEIHKAYAGYHTHAYLDPPASSWLRRGRRRLQQAYLARKYGYAPAENAFRCERLIGYLAYLHPGLRAGFEWKIMHLPAREGGRVLDVGCGAGGFLETAQSLGWIAQGIDFDPEAVAAARSRGMRAFVTSLEDYRPEGLYDAVTLSHVIEHVHDPLAVLRRCRSLLAPGGRLVAVTPNAEGWSHRRFGRNWRGLEPPRHLHIFHPRLLVDLANRAGFAHIEVKTSLRGADYMFIASRYIRRGQSFNMDERQPIEIRLWGQVMLFLEWFLMKMGRADGEEVVVIATK